MRKLPLTIVSRSPYATPAQAKSCAEPGNSSNYSAMANNSTPSLNRAFFVRGIYTPKERQDTPRSTERPSMVVRNGKGSPFAVFIAGRFSSPLRTTAQTLESLAVVPEKLLKGLSAMIYTFKALSRLDLGNTSKPIQSFPCYTLRIQADNLEQAKTKVCPLFAVLEVRYA